MSCTTCGSNVPCGCNGCAPVVTQDPALCCSTPATSGCCQNVVPAAPTPYYNCAPVCSEDHTQTLVVQKFSADVKINDSWNVPVCGEAAVVYATGLTNIVVGSYLWNPTYGYFEVISFNSALGQVVLQNNCNTGNAAAGTNVPACTEFTVTVPPCDCGNEGQVCVAIDFTAPAVGACIDITLTNLTGIQVEDTVQIGSGFYRVSALKPNDIITICNDGSGITPGTAVIAKNAAGQYQYCIQIISTTPCVKTAETTVAIIGCNGSDSIVPLDGNTQGWVATMIDTSQNNAAYRPLGIVNECTLLSANFVITAGVAAYTNVGVNSSSPFIVGDIIQFDGDPDVNSRFLITNIPNATHIDGQFTYNPVSTHTLPTGILVCLQSCCETLATTLDLVSSGESSTTQSPATSGTLNAGTPTIDTPTQTVTIVNSSDAVMSVFYTIEFQITARLQGLLTAPLDELSIAIYRDLDIPPVTLAAAQGQYLESTSNLFRRVDWRVTTSGVISIPANTSKDLKYFGRVTTLNVSTVTITLDSAVVKSSYLKIST